MRAWLTLSISVLLMTGQFAVAQQRIKVEEVYEIDGAEYEADPTKATRRFSGLTLFDRAGSIVEHWSSLSGPNDPPQYSRSVYSYNRNGRQSGMLLYQSALGSVGRGLAVERVGAEIKIVPELPEKLSEIRIWEYDRAGRQKEFRITDGDGNLRQRSIDEFDPRGNWIRSFHINAAGTITAEWNNVPTKNNHVEIKQLKGCLSGICRMVDKKDHLGRTILGERYSVQIGEGAGPDAPLVLTNRAGYKYVGDKETLEWTFWSDAGVPQQRLLMVSRGDDILSQKQFVRAVGRSQESLSSKSDARNSAIDWILSEEYAYEYILDARKGLVTEFHRYRDSPDKPLTLIRVVQRITSYL